jgi:hypothetical protein
MIDPDQDPFDKMPLPASSAPINGSIEGMPRVVIGFDLSNSLSVEAHTIACRIYQHLLAKKISSVEFSMQLEAAYTDRSITSRLRKSIDKSARRDAQDLHLLSDDSNVSKLERTLQNLSSDETDWSCDKRAAVIAKRAGKAVLTSIGTAFVLLGKCSYPQSS